MSRFQASRFSIISCIVFLSLFAQAGSGWISSGDPEEGKTEIAKSGWVSSGGELFRFDKNPWFVKNTKEVHYCVEVNQAEISASKQDIQSAILAAIQYWKDEFSKYQKPANGSGFADLATQNFIEHTQCPESPDIVLKFGYGTLTQEQADFLEDPRRYIGVTVRTSEYDRVNLKANGFIFISSDKGPHVYHNKGHLIDEAWQHTNLLKYALIHELGHVFGLPHAGAGLMSEVFMDQLLHKRFSRNYIQGDLQSYLHPPKELRVCSITGFFDPQFFSVDASTKCLLLKETKNFEYEIWAVQSNDASTVRIGTARLTSTTLKEMGAKPSTLIHLPKEQIVFGVKDRFLNTYMMGPVFTDLSGQGVFFKTGSHRPYHMYMELKPESISFVGTVSSKPKPVLVYTLPTLLKYQLPL